MPKEDPRDRRKEKEARIVDKLLKQLPYADPTLKGTEDRPQRPPAPRARRPPTPQASPRREGSPLGVWVRVLVALVLGVAVTQWPYRHDCGLAIVPYLLLVALILIMAGWAAIGSWRHRRAVAHVLSLGLIAWGLTLVAHEVLPRVGYAKAEASWACSAESEPAMPVGVPAVPDSAAPDSAAAGVPPVGAGNAPTSDSAGGT